MSLARKALDGLTSRLASAQGDERESAGELGSFSLGRVAERLGLTTWWQVPVGYQDERGFHPGPPPMVDLASERIREREESEPNLTSF